MIDCSLYILISFLVSMLLGLGLIPLVVSFCKVKRIYDLPNERKVHKVFVPRLGGVWLYRYYPWMRGMATSQIFCYNGIDKKASHVPL